MKSSCCCSRRSFLSTLVKSQGFIFAVGLGGSSLVSSNQSVPSKGAFVHDFLGSAQINGADCSKYQEFNEPIEVTTGDGSEILLTIDNDGYLVGPYSRVVFNYLDGYRQIEVKRGSLNAVVSRGENKERIELESNRSKVEMMEAAFYFESKEKKDYLCVCHGAMKLTAKASAESVRIKAKHHDKPKNIFGYHSSGELIRSSIVKNHSSYELGRVLDAKGDELIHAVFLNPHSRGRRKLF